MEDARVVGPVRFRERTRRRERNRNRGVPEQILACGRQRETLRRGDDQIGFAELPALRQRGKRRPRAGRPPARLDRPIAESARFDRREGDGVIEIAVAVFGQPRRHCPAGHGLNDLTSAPANRLILEDTERRAREADRIRDPDI